MAAEGRLSVEKLKFCISKVEGGRMVFPDTLVGTFQGFQRENLPSVISHAQRTILEVSGD